MGDPPVPVVTSRLPSLLLAVALLLRPLVSGAAYPFVEGFFAVVLLLALSLLLLGEKRAPDFFRALGLPLCAVLLYCGWTTLSLLWSRDGGQGLREVVSLASRAAGFLLAAAFLAGPARERRSWTVAAGAASLAAFLGAVHQGMFTFPGTRALLEGMGAAGEDPSGLLGVLATGRVFGGFLNPNLLAGFAAMALPFSLGASWAARTRAGKACFLLLAAFSLAVLLLSRSAGGMLAAMAGAALLPALAGRMNGRTAALAGLMAVTGSAAVLCFRGTAFLIGPDSSIAQRIGYMAAGWRMGAAAPPAGWGAGSVPGALMGFVSPSIRPVADPHNFLLREWAAGGAAGVALLLFFLVAWAARVIASLRRRRDPLLAGLASASAVFLLHSLIDMDFAVPETAFFGWAAMGGALGLSSPFPAAPVPVAEVARRFPRYPPVLAAVLLLFCLPAAAWVQGEVDAFLARSALREGRFADAGILFRKAMSRSPGGELDLGEGRALAGAGDGEAAAAAFLRARRLLPLSPYPCWELARLESSRGRSGESLAWYDRALVNFPSSPLLHLERARLLLRLGRREEARLGLALAEDRAVLEPRIREAAADLRVREGL